MQAIWNGRALGWDGMGTLYLTHSYTPLAKPLLVPSLPCSIHLPILMCCGVAGFRARVHIVFEPLF